MSLNTAIFRSMCRRSDAKRDAGLTTPADVRRIDDISYGPDEKWTLLDVYRPNWTEEKLPVIVSFHGGGWIYGDKEVYQFYCMDLARRGFAVVNYNYRLAPKYKFPAPMEDTNSVFAWLMKNAGEYGFDTGNIFAVGDSAGAMGIALYACVLTNLPYAARYDFLAPEGLSIKGLGLDCGVYTSESFKKNSDFIDRRRYDETISLMNVVDHVTDKFPPCFLLTSTGDFLKDEPAKLAPVLARCGVRYETRLYGTQTEQPGHVFHCDIRSETGRTANDEQCAFFRELSD